MDTYEAILIRRTIRKFKQEPISRELIEKIVNAGRLAPSAANMQPLKFVAVLDPAVCDRIFTHTRWAGYLKDAAPNEDERPTAYIAILFDKAIKEKDDTDAGAAAAQMILAAWSEGVASCWIGALSTRQDIMQIIGADGESFNLHTVLALGYPAMESFETAMPDDGSVKYFYDENGVFRVPKRALTDILRIIGGER